MTSAIDQPDAVAQAHAAIDRLPPGALSALLAAVARLCPRCGVPGTIRTSRRLRSDDGRMAYFVCECGHSWKGRVVSIQHTAFET
jgi:DNA-directed RNA polymerase subunit M/transcription elongation factor TFIIS